MNEKNADSLTKPSNSEAEPRDGLEEILEDIPPAKREQFEKIMIERSFEMIGQFSPESALSKKITPEHITDYLGTAKDNMINGYKERKGIRIFTFALVVVALAFFVIVILLLESNPDLLEKVIYAAVGLLAGAFGGYGIGRRKSSGD